MNETTNATPAAYAFAGSAKQSSANRGPVAPPRVSDDDAPFALFSDETPAFRTPACPDSGDVVAIRLRVESGLEVKPFLVANAGRMQEAMSEVRRDGMFTWYEAHLTCEDGPITYHFVVECRGRQLLCQKGGARWLAQEDEIDTLYDFRITPGFHVPEWAQGALMYQVFPDRFANGNPANDVRDGEYAYDSSHVRHERDWNALPTSDDYRHFYGGDLQGVAAKLDYLQSLGVEAIYLNPIFISPSSHGYDVQDYEHIDPHLTVIVDDLEHPLQEGDVRNAGALSYIRRTTSPDNLEASDAFFAAFCEEVHRRGMRIILDGVFNHCGSFSAWLNREGVYHRVTGYAPGAFESENSPYRHYFRFNEHHAHGYESWWGFPTLPKLNYENAPDLVEKVLDVGRKWALPPYSIDGWRLDVAADLGHSNEYNHCFWQRFRQAVKEANPDLLIIAEHYGDPSPWLQGGEWDTVMNYDAFMEPLTFFLTGMEKHSDFKRDDLRQDGQMFQRRMRECMARFDWPSLLSAMNELSNHDHSRFLTRTNRTIGRVESAGSQAAGANIDKRVFREAVAVQMTWPGAPTIYYADEAGQVGWTDPDCRRTYPWGNEDWGLIELHRVLAGIRGEHPSLRTGSFLPLGGGGGWIAFGRFQDADRMVTVCNNSSSGQRIRLRLRGLGAPDGAEAVQCLVTTDTGFRTERTVLAQVESGYVDLDLPGRSALVFELRDPA